MKLRLEASASTFFSLFVFFIRDIFFLFFYFLSEMNGGRNGGAGSGDVIVYTAQIYLVQTI